MNACRLVALLLATVTAPSSPADAASTHAPASGGRLLSSLLGYPSSCRHNAAAYRCTLTLTCWLVGGQLTPGCSQSGGPLDVVADLLFTCCVPSHHHNHPPPPPPPKLPPPPPHSASLLSAPPNGLPSRREDIDHRNNQLLDVTPIECGIPQLTFRKRIIGGNEAYFGEFPWQAHIRIAGYQCGGVLVSQWYVATAAHCIHRARLKDIIVFLGEYDTQNTGQYMEPLPEETFRVIKKIIHPNFQFRITQPDRFDLALLRLSRPVFYRENILPICLPKHNEAFMGHTGVVAGWGKTDTTYGKTGTNILQKATVPILSDEECLKWHEHKNINLELYSEMFCAGHSDGHMDACLGDSGGPLIVKVNGRWTLAGITSAGFGCAVDHQPGIYHKVADTAHWIVAHVEGKK